MRINITKFIILCFATLIMFIGNLMSARVLIDYRQVENIWMLTFLITLVIAFFVSKFSINISKHKLLFVLLWELFILSISTSKFVHGDFKILEFVLYSALIPFAFFSININKYTNTILVSYIISILPFLYVIDTNNNIGLLLCFGGIVILMLFRIKNISDIYIYLFIIVISILLFITNSRTSLFSFLIVAAIMILSMIIRKSQSLFDIMKKGITLIVTGTIVVIFANEVRDLLFNKTINTSRDISSGRFEIWTDIIKNKVSIFGSNINYLLNYNARDAHNTFIQVLADYGFISCTLFLIIFILIIYKSILSTKLEYILFFVGYFLIGLTENVFFIDNRLVAIHILFFVVLGSLLNNKNQKFKKQDIESNFNKNI